jgi:NADH:ubiquinone oxidoreductase subunit E
MMPDSLFFTNYHETGFCFGACAQAPVMVIKDSVYGKMNHFKAQKLLNAIRKQKEF